MPRRLGEAQPVGDGHEDFQDVEAIHVLLLILQ
jgi:hypothetical protein